MNLHKIKHYKGKHGEKTPYRALTINPVNLEALQAPF